MRREREGGGVGFWRVRKVWVRALVLGLSVGWCGLWDVGRQGCSGRSRVGADMRLFVCEFELHAGGAVCWLSLLDICFRACLLACWACGGWWSGEELGADKRRDSTSTRLSSNWVETH